MPRKDGKQAKKRELCPTPTQIAARARRIRQQWSESERDRRREEHPPLRFLADLLKHNHRAVERLRNAVEPTFQKLRTAAEAYRDFYKQLGEFRVCMFEVLEAKRWSTERLPPPDRDDYYVERIPFSDICECFATEPDIVRKELFRLIEETPEIRHAIRVAGFKDLEIYE
jgi:hypothetical protein